MDVQTSMIIGIIRSIGYKRNVFMVGDFFSRTIMSACNTSKVKQSLADTLSRLPFDERQNPCDLPVNTVVHKLELADAKTMHKGSSRQEWADEELGSAHTAPNDLLHATNDPLHTCCSIATDDDNLLDCFIHLPVTENVPFVLDYGTIAQAQGGDAHLMQLLVPNTHIWCYLESPNQLENISP
jgi:hypothetical protein